MAMWQGPVPVHSASLYFSNNKYRSIDIMLRYTVCILDREDMMFLSYEFFCLALHWRDFGTTHMYTVIQD